MARKNEFERELLAQFLHTWKMLNDLVDEATEEEWTSPGMDYLQPVRLALHIMLAAEYFTDQASEMRSRYKGQWAEFHDENLPGKAEFTAYARRVQKGVGAWVLAGSLDEPEERFPWAGSTRRAVSVFLLRHSLYHLGELNAILFTGREGGIPDPWMG